MTAATSRLRRRGIGAGVAALVGLSGLGFAAMPAQAAAGFNPAATQVSGVDRFDTAAQIATKAFTTATTVVVVNGDRAIDAQAGAYVAGLNNAPILLTQKSNVPTYTVDAIKKLGATKAIVLGDSNSVDATALAQMTAAGLSVQVVSGTDRFATAAAIYNLGTTKASTVFLARADLLAGQVSPDALAASPLSYDGTPVLLTNAASLPQATADAIKNGGVKNVVVLGNAITDSVKTAVTALGATVTTIAGDDRSLTAQKIADYGIAQGKFQKTTATIANGDKIDALAAGPWAAKNNAPILLTLGTNSLGTGTTNYLTANASTLTTGVAFGDTNSVPASLSTAAVAAAQGGTPTSNQAFAIAGGGSATDVRNGAGNVTYTVTGLSSGTTYNIGLFNTSNVSNTGGLVTFPNNSNPGGTGNVANATSAANVNITVLNGISRSATPSALNVTPVNGQITFTVNGAANTPASTVPVVWSAADGNTNLNLGLDNRPTEAFAVGSAANFIVAAAAGTFGSYSFTSPVAPTEAVTAIGADFITTAVGTFQIKSGDTFQIWNSTTSQYSASDASAFRAALSVGDSIGGLYQTSGASTFVLNDLAPLAPGGVSAVTNPNTSGDFVGKGGVVVAFNDSATSSTGSYNVYRATAIEPTVTGGSPTQPTIASGAFTKVGTVANVSSRSAYTFNDTTAAVPATGAVSPRYYYYVTAVDTTGDEGVASSIVGPVTAVAPSAAAGSPVFAAASVTNATTVVLTYNQAIATSSVATTDGSDFTVTRTVGGVSTVVTPLSAAASSAAGSYVNASGATVTGVGRVTLTLPANSITSGSTVQVGVKAGSDGNTVSNTASTPLFQATTDAVQAIAPDLTAPTVAAQANAPTTGSTSVQFLANEAIDGTTLASGDFTLSGTGAAGAATGTAVIGTPTPASDGVTITVPISGSGAGRLAVGDVVTLSGSVSDIAGNASTVHPATTAVVS